MTAQLIDRGWSTRQVVFLFGLLMLLFVSASFAVSRLPEEHLLVARLAALLVMQALMLGAAALILRRRGTAWPEYFGMQARKLRFLLLSPLLYLACLPLLIAVSAGWQFLLEHLFGVEPHLQDLAEIIRQAPPGLRACYILTAVIVTPVYEEILFRGTLYPYLVKHAGNVHAAVMTSLFFAFMHFHVPAAAALVLLSLILCEAYLRTGSLWICIGMHALFNGVSVLILLML